MLLLCKHVQYIYAGCLQRSEEGTGFCGMELELLTVMSCLVGCWELNLAALQDKLLSSKIRTNTLTKIKNDFIGSRKDFGLERRTGTEEAEKGLEGRERWEQREQSTGAKKLVLWGCTSL